MKVNLLIDNPGDVRNGYVNIDEFASDDDPFGRVAGDIYNLHDWVDDGEAIEIIALDILDYCTGGQADNVLSHWLSKLAYGGRLTLSVVDVREVARAILANSIDYETINELLHGKQERPGDCRMSAYTLAQLVEVLTNRGYKVIAKRIQHFRAIVTVERKRKND